MLAASHSRERSYWIPTMYSLCAKCKTHSEQNWHGLCPHRAFGLRYRETVNIFK